MVYLALSLGTTLYKLDIHFSIMYVRTYIHTTRQCGVIQNIRYVKRSKKKEGEIIPVRILQSL